MTDDVASRLDRIEADNAALRARVRVLEARDAARTVDPDAERPPPVGRRHVLEKGLAGGTEPVGLRRATTASLSTHVVVDVVGLDA